MVANAKMDKKDAKNTGVEGSKYENFIIWC